MKKAKLTPDEEVEVRIATEPLAFEEYCGACDWYGTDQCPHLGRVTDLTWWPGIRCENFYD